MEKFKVTFEANDQQLKAVGTKHASDTYADIEATFVLGEKWTDMDSVSAVWWNDFTRVATVLDSNGKCIVPHEVLTRKGCVRVNLVGSIVEGDELITRLTSYSAEAVQVNEKIKLTGTETSEITPSQYEQFVANVKADADRAEEGATASEQSAQSASESATASADSATSSAQSATASAESAQNASESAQSAENAKDDAEDARDKILGMRATAETLEAGSDATASYSDGLLTLGIPRGDKGEQGIQGETGATPNFSIGEVDTLEPNESATATITGTAENPVLNLGIPKGEQGDVNLSQLEALLPTETASSEIVTIIDGQSVIPVKSLEVELEPIQDLHGYDKPWVGGAGKNLFDGQYPSISSSLRYRAIQVGNGTFTMSTTLPLDNGSANVFFLPGNVTSGASSGTNGVWANNPQTATAVDGYVTVAYRNLSGSIEYNPQNYHTQIEEGSTATSYEPYSNICPISGRTEVVTHRTGINAWDGTVESGKWIGDYTTGEVVSTSSSYNVTDLIPVKPNTAYYMMRTGSSRNIWYDANKNAIPMTLWAISDTPKVITSPANAYYIRFTVTATYLDSFGLNYPSTDTDYHAYNGNTYHTDLGQTVYGGTLDVVSGELVVDRAMVDLGTLAWNKTSTYMYAQISDKRGSLNAGMPNEVISNKYATTSVIVASSNLENGYMTEGYGNYSILINIRDDSLIGKSASEIKTAMNGVQLVYQLATPQTYQLDPQTIDLLLGTNNVWSDGTVTVVYSADIQKWVEKKLGTRTTLTMSRPMVQTETETETSTEETETETE